MTADLYVLDTSPLGLVTNPRESEDGRRCKAWLRQALSDWRTLAEGREPAD